MAKQLLALSLTTADHERLIDIVRGYPVLYDPSHKDYKDINVGKNIWDEISEEFSDNYPGFSGMLFHRSAFCKKL
jgi:hypothetical protein